MHRPVPPITGVDPGSASVGAAAATVVAARTGGRVAIAAGADTESPITGPDLPRALAAALAHTGGGTVTDTEVGDEESRYEVEVTMPDGRQTSYCARSPPNPHSRSAIR